MNVKSGDLARIVGTTECNEGAIVRVLERDHDWSFSQREPWWRVEGANLAQFEPGTPWPTSVGTIAAAPDRLLRRINPDELPEDTRIEDEVMA
jgi:hypothetical protein